MTKPRTLAIIGGGASCTLLLANLAKENAQFSAIEVFDRNGAFGLGIAYSTPHESHLLNVRAANMSGYQDDKDDLVNWLAKNAPQYGGIDFIPRKLYGVYLESLLRYARSKLPVTLTKEDVLSVKAGHVETAHGVKIFDEIVLASGNVRPLSVEADLSCRKYHSNPYDMDYDAIPKDGHVVVVGTGLSGVDAITGLVAAGFKGTITSISRNGWFPATHAAPQVWEALNSELNDRSPADWMKEIRHYVQRAVEAGMFWQTAIDSLRAETNPIWQAMSEAQRATFMRHGLSAWNIHRHRMPTESAAMIDELKRAKRLKVVSDKAMSIRQDGVVMCGKCVIEGADAVINGLGYRYDEGRDFDVSHRIGPARFGELFETTAMPEIRAQAQEIAKALMK